MWLWRSFKLFRRLGHVMRAGDLTWHDPGPKFWDNVWKRWMNSYTKCGGAARRRLCVICKKTEGGGRKSTPPPGCARDVKIECFQIMSRKDLMISSFLLKFPTNALKSHGKGMTEWTCHIMLGSRSRAVYKGHCMHFFNESCDTCYMGQFERRTRWSWLFHHLTSFDQSKMRYSVQGQVKYVKKVELRKLEILKRNACFGLWQMSTTGIRWAKNICQNCLITNILANNTSH